MSEELAAAALLGAGLGSQQVAWSHCAGSSWRARPRKAMSERLGTHRAVAVGMRARSACRDKQEFAVTCCRYQRPL